MSAFYELSGSRLQAPVKAKRDMAARPELNTDALRLRDRVSPGIRVLFVGINPGVRSATTGHHFAGYSNRFWKLLFDSRLTPELLHPEDDVRLPEWGYGVTNLVARPTPGIDTLRREEYAEGLRILRRKVRRWRPHCVALVGVTLFRSIFALPASRHVALGSQAERFENIQVFVLPNPSGRNANFSYREMLSAFKDLAARARSMRRVSRPARTVFRGRA